MDGWIIDAALIYDKGLIRKHNEDSCYFDGYYAALSDMDRTEYLRKTAAAPGTLWAVCDGMGGQSNGEAASCTAVSDMPGLQKRLQESDFSGTVQHWIGGINDSVRENTGGGTTLVMLYCTNQYIETAHIGDSRIYRMHDGILSRLTRDHSQTEMMVAAGLITEEEAKNHPRRHTVIRYLGMDSEYTVTASVGEKLPYIGGDRYLLCSDGVTDMLPDTKLEELLKAPGDCEACASAVRNAVFAAGARDNMTLIVLDVRSA